MQARDERAPLNVLFVCYGNACRSQMAEAFASHLGEGRVRAWSAGSRPFGSILAETYTVLAEKGISLDGHRSKGLEDVPVAQMDIVVTMGCEVECPVPKNFKGRVVEWEIDDPFGMDLDYFRSVRDTIELQVEGLLACLSSSQKV